MMNYRNRNETRAGTRHSCNNSVTEALKWYVFINARYKWTGTCRKQLGVTWGYMDDSCRHEIWKLQKTSHASMSFISGPIVNYNLCCMEKLYTGEEMDEYSCCEGISCWSMRLYEISDCHDTSVSLRPVEFFLHLTTADLFEILQSHQERFM